MRSRVLSALPVLTIVCSLLIAGCGTPATPETVIQTVVVPQEVQVTVEVPQALSPLTGTHLKVAAILQGPVNDAGWTTLAYLGLIGLRDKYGYEIAYSENVAPPDSEEVMRAYAEAGYDVIYSHGFYFDQIHAVAEEYPETSFIQVNDSADDLNNLYTVTFSAGEGGYFMGRLACQITESGKVAYVAGSEFPPLSHHIKMSRQACEDIGKGDVEIIESYVGAWDDPAKAKELAKADIEQGVDVLILEADAGDIGTITAAQEAAAEGKYIRVISWVRDKNYLAPDLVIGGWEERVPRLMEFALERIVLGELGGHFALGLKEGANALNPFYGLVPLEVEDDIVKTLQEYMKDPSSLPNLEVRTDL